MLCAALENHIAIGVACAPAIKSVAVLAFCQLRKSCRHISDSVRSSTRKASSPNNHSNTSSWTLPALKIPNVHFTSFAQHVAYPARYVMGRNRSNMSDTTTLVNHDTASAAGSKTVCEDDKRRQDVEEIELQPNQIYVEDTFEVRWSPARGRTSK